MNFERRMETKTRCEKKAVHQNESTSNNDWQAIISGRWKYMENNATGARWLFDVVADPKETHNLLGEQSERAARMKKELDWR